MSSLTLSSSMAEINSELLDPSFLFALDNGEKFSIQPVRFTALFKMTKVKVNNNAALYLNCYDIT